MLQQHKKRSAVRSSTAGAWIIMMMLQSTSSPTTAYNLSSVTRSFPGRKRSLSSMGLCSASDARMTYSHLPCPPNHSQGTRPQRGTPMRMALDSRELRFYASSKSSPVARALSSLPTSATKAACARIVTASDDGAAMSSILAQTTAVYTSRLASMREADPRANRDLLDSVAPPALSIYNSGLLGLFKTFDSEAKRAFAHSGSPAWSAQYSTSSVLLTSLSEDPTDIKPDFQNKPPDHKTTPSIQIDLTDEEQELFDLLRTVTKECGMKSTLRVAGGWVRDKILASPEFKQHRARMDLHDEICTHATVECDVSGDGTASDDGMDRITSKFKGDKNGSSISPDKSLSVTVPVDIDIALDDKLGREFADELNQWLSSRGRETHSVGVVLKNPEKSKHLETATMRVNNYWIDFVNLRAEEYTSDSRIPDLMRIGTAEEDAFRRDLTINALFYNINDGVVEDMTGRGLDDLRKGVVATPLPPLTTLLDDPLRVLRSVRFAARLRFGMAESLREAAADARVRMALAQKVSRERVGSEVDLMLKSRDPVGAMRLLVNLGLIDTVFPLPETSIKANGTTSSLKEAFDRGLALLATTHDHLCDCKANPPVWCEAKRALEAGAVNGVGKDQTRVLMEDEDARRLLWYASFLKPLRDFMLRDENIDDDTRKKPRKANRSVVIKLLVDELKRPMRDAEAVDKIIKAADEFTKLVSSGSGVSATIVLISGAHVVNARNGFLEGDNDSKIMCTMENKVIDPDSEDDPLWTHSMEFRRECADVLRQIGPSWRAAFVLSLCEQLMDAGNDDIEFMIEGDVVHEAQEEVNSGILAQYDGFAAAMMQLSLIGIWKLQPLVKGDEIKQSVLPNIPKGPVFGDVMELQTHWMTSHPGGSKEKLIEHIRSMYPDYV